MKLNKNMGINYNNNMFFHQIYMFKINKLKTEH